MKKTIKERFQELEEEVLMGVDIQEGDVVYSVEPEYKKGIVLKELTVLDKLCYRGDLTVRIRTKDKSAGGTRGYRVEELFKVKFEAQKELDKKLIEQAEERITRSELVIAEQKLEAVKAHQVIERLCRR
jgi:hypothetical protein